MTVVKEDKYVVSSVSRNGHYPAGDEDYFKSLDKAIAHAVVQSWDEDVWGVWTNDDAAELLALIYQQTVFTP